MRTFLCVLSDFIGLKQICKISLFANTLNIELSNCYCYNIEIYFLLFDFLTPLWPNLGPFHEITGLNPFPIHPLDCPVRTFCGRKCLIKKHSETHHQIILNFWVTINVK